METYMHKTMASVASLEKNEIIRSQEFMLSEARLQLIKVYMFVCIKFVSVLYEIMWNTCVTLIYSFIMYILICTSRSLLQYCTSKSNVV